MVRGDVYFVELKPRSGSEQAGRRPAVVVSTDAFNLARGWKSITILPLTTSARWKASYTVVRFRKGEANLPKSCSALAHQITTIDRSKLIIPKIGTLSKQKMLEIEDAILNYLELDH